MSVETIKTLVIGAGQAGLAMSEHLLQRGEPHLVLERQRIAERWRSERWDSLVANGPAWHDRFPTREFDCDPQSFATAREIADYFAAHAADIGAPIRCGVEVTALRRKEDGSGFRAETPAGAVDCRNVVVATGPFQRPVIPPLVPAEAGLLQIHSRDYRNPAQLPPGAVLVIGAGSSGAQIADELLRAGRPVTLSVGPHNRPPRRYRGRDFVWWLGVLGLWDVETRDPATEHVTIAVSGAHGGETIDFRRFANRGMLLVGRAEACADGVMRFAPDLADNIARGDADYLSILDSADDYVARQGLDLPSEPDARRIEPTPACVLDPIPELDLAKAGIASIVWATGYALDFSWLQVDAFDEKGRPVHRKGVSEIPGLYFLGLPWLSRRSSAFIWGAWRDAKDLAEHIVRRG